MTEKHRFSLERWKLLIQDYQQSGMTVKQWCSLNCVTKDAYYYWLRQIQRNLLPEALNALQTSQNAPAFVDVTPMKETDKPDPAVCIDQPAAVIRKSGIEIEIFSSASPRLVQLLLKGVNDA